MIISTVIPKLRLKYETYLFLNTVSRKKVGSNYKGCQATTVLPCDGHVTTILNVISVYFKIFIYLFIYDRKKKIFVKNKEIFI